MDYSKYIRMKNEAANVYVARNKTVDSSFLTLKRQNKAAYSGYTDIQAVPYYNGAPVVYPILYDISSCPADHQYTQGFTTVNKQGTQELKAFRMAGCAVCNDVDYSTASPGIQLKNCNEVSTILNEYNLTSSPGGPKAYGYGLVPGEWKAYGYGKSHYFPRPDSNSDCGNCDTNKVKFPSG
jgi:hypothetical protein